MAQDVVLSLDHAARVFGAGPRAVRAVDDVTLAFHAGRFHAILGPSGSGKSTLLHLAAGLEAPSSGRVTILGADVSALDDAALARLRRRSVGLVFQFFNLMPSLTVEENAMLPVLLDRPETKADRARLAALLERLGLRERRTHRPEELSGGERQRAAILRALMPAPPILLADEPTGSLDSAAGERLGTLLRNLAREDGTCVVAVTHDRRLAEQADVIVRLRDGRIESSSETRTGSDDASAADRP